MHQKEGRTFNRASEVRFLPAVSSLFFLVFGRLSETKILGICALATFLYFLTSGSLNVSPLLHGGLPRIEAFQTPTVLGTQVSQGSIKLAEEEKRRAELVPGTENLSFSKKLTVFATSYDKYCKGCNDITATGLKAGYGVIAVDPRVIPLGSKVFVPGYGTAVAGDTGGAIKGNKIDLGFDDVKKGWWSARHVEIYLLK